MIRTLATGLIALGLALPASLPSLHAQEALPEGEARDQVTQALFESEDQAGLDKAIAAARAARVPNQAILEARFLFLVDQQDFAAVAAMAPVLEVQKVIFKIEDSVIFSVQEEFFAIVEFCHALRALEKNDHSAFKKHITEAFWLSPRQANAFAPHIERLRQEQAMARVHINLAGKFARQTDGKEISLEELSGDSKHLVLHFWSPWSTECEDNLPDFLAMVGELGSHQIPVASVLIEPGADALKAAKEFHSGIEARESGYWIVDNLKPSLARLLRVQQLPSIALINREGKVLFSGHPSEERLWRELQNVNPKVGRPRLDREQ